MNGAPYGGSPGRVAHLPPPKAAATRVGEGVVHVARQRAHARRGEAEAVVAAVGAELVLEVLPAAHEVAAALRLGAKVLLLSHLAFGSASAAAEEL